MRLVATKLVQSHRSQQIGIVNTALRKFDYRLCDQLYCGVIDCFHQL